MVHQPGWCILRGVLYLMLFPGGSRIQAVKAVKQLLGCDLSEAVAAVSKNPVCLDEAMIDIEHVQARLTRDGIAYEILDGPPKQVNKCCICDTDTVRHWMPYSLFADPDDAQAYGGQPFCDRCWRTVPFERFFAIMHPPTVWDRVTSGVWGDE